jgi:hypothetical protein
MEKNINEIRELMKKIKEEEYKKNNYQSKEEEIIEKKNKMINDREANIEINKLKNNMYKNIQRKEFKTNRFIDKTKIEEIPTMENCPEAFNIVYNEKDYMDWKQLSIDERKEILEEYFNENNSKNGIEYDDEIKNDIRELVKNNKIVKKQDIIFDKINQKILEIPLIKCIDNKLIIKEEEKKMSIKRQKKNSINKLLKIK